MLAAERNAVLAASSFCNCQKYATKNKWKKMEQMIKIRGNRGGKGGERSGGEAEGGKFVQNVKT